ncbi:MAG TPA: hypothetical protein PKE12_02195 [Kiritimatiellia bacterium]|nr:hypothetical protein [Kiritimatiellia bacterium]
MDADKVAPHHLKAEASGPVTEPMEKLLERIAVALEAIAGHLAHDTAGAAPKPISAASRKPLALSPAPASETSGLIERYLNERGITIKSRPPEDPADELIDSLSLYLGNRYQQLTRLLAQIKSAMQDGGSITHNLSKAPQADVSTICQFCSRLHQIAFFEQYRYLKAPHYVLKIKTTKLPKAQRFFSGQWLERYIVQSVRAIHQRLSSASGKPLYFEALVNPQISLPNGDDFEFDILAVIGDALYWIEAKSGDYQQHVSKYSRISRLLGLDAAHSFMVLTDVADSACAHLSSLFSMTTCNLTTIEEKLISVVQNDSGITVEQPQHAPPVDTKDEPIQATPD